MIKDLISSFDLFDLLLVYSFDAGTSVEEGWHSFETFKSINNKHKILSVGMFLDADNDYIYLCQDIETDVEDGDFHTINAIPLGSIIKIHLLNIKE